ncbi:MAG: hypothetical protein ACXAEU_25855, partial [Candidatus Hodarchaeales archaeon]
EQEIKKILAYIDCLLRLDGNTIRWKTLVEIGDYFGFEINKRSLFKHRFRAHEAFFASHGRKWVLEKLRKSPVLIMKQVVTDFITTDTGLSLEEKMHARKESFRIIDMIRAKRFIPRDYEIYAHAIYQLVTKNNYTLPVDELPIPTPRFKKAVINAIYNIQTKVLKENIPVFNR